MIARQHAGRPPFPATLPDGSKQLHSYAAAEWHPETLQSLPRIFGSPRTVKLLKGNGLGARVTCFQRRKEQSEPIDSGQ